MSWFLGTALGYAAGTGFNHLREQNQIRQALDPRLYQPVTAPLPVGRWSVAQGVCRVGMPDVWRGMTSDEIGRLTTDTRARVVLGTCVTAPDPRLGCSATSFAVLDRGPGSAGPDAHLMFVAPDQMVQARTEAVPELSSYGAPWRIGIDGERALVHHMVGSAPGAAFGVGERVALMVGEAFVVRGTTLYIGSFVSPTETYQAYLPHFWTMLANWRWLPRSQ
jgi:hypothetical protein